MESDASDYLHVAVKTDKTFTVPQDRDLQCATELSQHLRVHLDSELAAGFLHCNMHADETLVVVASSPEWAARLRFASSELLTLSREFGMPATRVKVKVSVQSR